MQRVRLQRLRVSQTHQAIFDGQEDSMPPVGGDDDAEEDQEDLPHHASLPAALKALPVPNYVNTSSMGSEMASVASVSHTSTPLLKPKAKAAALPNKSASGMKQTIMDLEDLHILKLQQTAGKSNISTQIEASTILCQMSRICTWHEISMKTIDVYSGSPLIQTDKPIPSRL